MALVQAQNRQNPSRPPDSRMWALRKIKISCARSSMLAAKDYGIIRTCKHLLDRQPSEKAAYCRCKEHHPFCAEGVKVLTKSARMLSKEESR